MENLLDEIRLYRRWPVLAEGMYSTMTPNNVTVTDKVSLRAIPKCRRPGQRLATGETDPQGGPKQRLLL